MAATQSSPVLVQHVSPLHTLDTFVSDVSPIPLSTVSIETQREEPTVQATQSMEQAPEHHASTDTPRVQTELIDMPMADAPNIPPISDVESREETQIVPTDPEPVEQPPSDQPPPPIENVPATTEATPTSAENSPPVQATPESQPAIPEPAPPPPQAEAPEWVTWEDDTSTPSEDELKEVLSTEENALDVPSIEKKVYEEVDDPEQRPAKKIRLSWVIKGVRGTKERPNKARTMNSPCALVDGHYWQIKFFPRGNKSSSLSAYIRCTKHLPTPDQEVPESTFSYFEGPPDADMGTGAEPKKVMHVAASPVKEEKGSTQNQPDEPGTSRDSGETPAQGSATEPADSAPAESEGDRPATKEVKTEPPPDEDYRVSAQLGMVIYNPDEPRTCSFNSSEHQFTKHNDDWGWTNFVGPWQDIHKRQRGQRQPLLKNDTIAIDAYIRIFDDPSQSLWWHVSHDHESIWPSKKLAGYFPMGTPPLYHSPAVAGITAWMLLAPFRKILQSVDAGKWRQSSQIKPRPLIARTQYVLHLMRHLRKDDYVNVNPIIDTLKESGESFNDVKSFWESFRRSIELELEGETDALEQLSEIFGASAVFSSVPRLSVKGVDDVQSALQAAVLPKELENSAPNFLPLMLEREVFDKQTCEWKLCHDRVTLNDEITLSRGDKYTLYGFMVHVGVRNSGKFYSILRPNGSGTKWLAFEDGDGNKVFSYTRKRIQEYEGLAGEELRNFKSTRQTAYMVMYIKNSCVESYLPGKLEDYNAPLWLSANLGERPDDWQQQLSKELEDVDKDGIAVEIYNDQGILGRQGLLDMFNVKQQALAQDNFWALKLSKETTFREIRHDLASRLSIDNVEKLRLFVMSYGEVGQYNSAQWEPVKLGNNVGIQAFLRRPLCLWLSVLQREEDVKSFGIPDPVDVETPEEKPEATPEEVEAANTGNTPTDILAPASEEVAMEEGSNATDTTDAQADSGTAVSVEIQQGSESTIQQQTDTVSATLPIDDAVQPVTEAPSLAQTPMGDDASGVSVAQAINPEARPSDEAPPSPQSSLTSPEAVMQDVVDVDPWIAALAAEISAPVGPVPTVQSALSSPETDMEDGLTAQTVSEPTPFIPGNVVDTSASAETLNIPETAGSIALNLVEPTLEIPEPPAVEHGHLVDAVMSDAPAVPPVDAATVIQQAIDSVREAQNQAEASTDDIVALEEAEIVSLPRRVSNVYGFLQVFDPDEQNFRVHCTFFAKRDEPAKEAVRKSMGFDADKSFHAWHRETTLDGSAIDEKMSFEDINFSDGVDIIAGEILSDSKKEELRKQGKFTNPFALSRYLRMAERRHPIQACTSSEPVEIADFGMNYYKGPLVNGQPHGENCLMITAHGHTYEGPLVMNDKDGPEGKMTYQNGDVYEGGWKNDERHGQGTFDEKRTGNKYVGGFQNGKRWGKGVTHWQVADEEADMCQICYGEEIDALFFDCGHVCSCVECAKQCDVCPICRRSVRQVVRMFWA